MVFSSPLFSRFIIDGRVLLLKCSNYTGTTVKYVLEQDKASFIRLIGVSVLQSGASSFIAPSLR